MQIQAYNGQFCNFSTGYCYASKIAMQILFVEPYDDFRHVFSVLLRFLGHRVETASNATDALDKIKASAPDVVLTELYLEDVAGPELARQIRLLPSAKHIALVAITGYAGPDTETVALEAGFNYFLVKPVTGEQVEEVLQDVAETKGRKPGRRFH